MEEQEYNRQKRALDQLKDLYGEESEEYKAAKDALGQAINAARDGKGTAGGTARGTVSASEQEARDKQLLDYLRALHSKSGTFFQGTSSLRDKRPTAESVPDIGLYFPFVNREEQLDLLHKRLQFTLNWYFDKHGIDSSKGFFFTLCHGISGIGKTTFACEGINALLRRSQMRNEEWLANYLHCRVSYTDVSISPQHERHGETSIAMRILYAFLQSLGMVDIGYSTWLELHAKSLELLTLRKICDFIFDARKLKPGEKQLLVLHIDETQEFLQSEQLFLKQILKAIYELNEGPKIRNTIVFSVLTGTNPSVSYKAFKGTSYGIREIPIPPMRVPHIRVILNALAGKPHDADSEDKELNKFITFIELAIGGHPRLLGAFVSKLSERGLTCLKRDETEDAKGERAFVGVEEEKQPAMAEESRAKGKERIREEAETPREVREEQIEAEEENQGREEENQGGEEENQGGEEEEEEDEGARSIRIPQGRKPFTEADKENLGPLFYIRGYDAFFTSHMYSDIAVRWDLIKTTWSSVQVKQFPEVSLGVLQEDDPVWQVAKETVLILLLSDRELLVKRKDKIKPPHHRGQTAMNNLKFITWGELESHGGVILDPIPGQNPEEIAAWQFKVHVPFVLASTFLQDNMTIPREPLMTLEWKLTPDQNEEQDLVVLLHKLCAQPTATCKLADILPGIPGLDQVLVEIPSNPKWVKESMHIKSPAQLLPLLQEYLCSAFINANDAPFCDSFIILKLKEPIDDLTHVVLLLQSKRRETAKKRKEIDKELFWDFEKTIFKHRDAFTEHHLLPVYIYITDSKRFGTEPPPPKKKKQEEEEAETENKEEEEKKEKETEPEVVTPVLPFQLQKVNLDTLPTGWNLVTITGEELSLGNMGIVVKKSGHNAFYGQYRTKLKKARNLQPKGKKRKSGTTKKHQVKKKPKGDMPKKITDITILEKLKGNALKEQMKAWGVSYGSDKVALKRDRLVQKVKEEKKAV